MTACYYLIRKLEADMQITYMAHEGMKYGFEHGVRY